MNRNGLTLTGGYAGATTTAFTTPRWCLPGGRPLEASELDREVTHDPFHVWHYLAKIDPSSG